MLFGVCATTQSSHGHWDTLWEYIKYLSFGQFIDWLAAQITEQCMWRLGADLITGFKALLTRGQTSSWFQDHKLITATCVRKATSHMVAVITLRYWTSEMLCFGLHHGKFSESGWFQTSCTREHPAPSHLSFPWFEYELVTCWLLLLIITILTTALFHSETSTTTSNPLFRVCDSDHNGTSFYNLRYSIILYIPLLYPDSLFYYSK